jgi:hypothetical protein
MNLCKNCQHAKIGTFTRCLHPKNMRVNLVEGGTSTIQTPMFLRDHADLCGPEGSWFEPIKVQDIES